MFPLPLGDFPTFVPLWTGLNKIFPLISHSEYDSGTEREDTENFQCREVLTILERMWIRDLGVPSRGGKTHLSLLSTSGRVNF